MGPLSRLRKLLIRKKKKKQKALEKAASEPVSPQHPVPPNDSSTGPKHDTFNFYGRREAPLNPKDPGIRRPTDLQLRLLIRRATIEVISIIKEASEASSVLTPVTTLCRVLNNVLELASTRISNELTLLSLIKRLDAHSELADREKQGIVAQTLRGHIYPPHPAFLDALQAYIKTLETIATSVIEYQRAAFSAPDKQNTPVGLDLEVELDTRFGTLVRQVQNCILDATLQIRDLTVDARLSQLLKGSIDARGDRVKPLTSGTRVALIERLSTWAQSKDNVEQIFWLRDKAGTGKSTLAAHMANKWHIEGILAARWFFDQNGGRPFRRVDSFCVSIARELSEYYPAAKEIILEAIAGNSERADGPFHEVFSQLLTSVVGRISRYLDRPLVFVIDALDECNHDDVQLLMTALLSGSLGTENVRFFVTSRPTKELSVTLDGATKVGGNGIVLLDVKSGDSARDHDVAIYVRRTLERFSVAEQDLVIECAKGVFLWATLACDTLERAVSPTTLLHRLQSNTPDKHMSSLYETVLEAALPQDQTSQDLRLLRSVLQGITLTYTPVSIFSVQSFFPSQRDAKVEGQEYVEFFVKRLGSIMKDGTPYLPIYLLHPTFREFVEAQKQGAKFYVSPPAGHHTIAMACLDLLEGINWNVLGLADPKLPLPIYQDLESENPRPPQLYLDTEAPFRYAVTFWATHVALALGEDEVIRERTCRFFESSFLAWLEWSSALEELSEAVDGLRLLRQSMRVQVALGAPKMGESMVKWCIDSLRFLQRNSHLISRCGLQVWMSALVFTPRKSIVYQTFHRTPVRPLPEVLTDQPDTFDSHRILYDVGQYVFLAAVSPDGKRILTHEGSGTLRLWNIKPFRLIRKLVHQQSFGTPDAKFSTDGSVIASGGGQAAEIYIWDGFSGAPQGENGKLLPQLHSGFLVGLVFALSDSVVVSVAEDGKIVRWNVAPGMEGRLRRGRVIRGDMHSDKVSKIAVSPDGKLVATFSYDQTIRLWNPERMEGVGTPMLGNAAVRNGAFSTDGTKVVAGYENGEVIIWNAATQALIHRLESDEKWIYNLIVSPDGTTVACGNARLCLWDITTGKLICPPLVGHTDYVSRLAFGRGGKRLVSGSRDRTVRVWDIHRDGANVHVDGFALRGHAGCIEGLALSIDGGTIVSASADGTLRLWHADLRDRYDSNDPIDYTHDDVKHLVFSRDGHRLLTAGKDGTFQMWDPVAGKKHGHLLPSQGKVARVIPSWNNNLWASVHEDGNVCLWQYDGDGLEPEIHSLACHQAFVPCVAFAPDGSLVAMGGSDNVAQLWDIASRSYIGALNCFSQLCQIAVSHDSKVIATYSADKHIRLWDVECQSIITDPGFIFTSNERFDENKMDHMVFSPDGKSLAASAGSMLQLFDLGEHMRGFVSVRARMPFESDIYPKPAFSDDSRYLFFQHHIVNLATLSRDQSTNSWPRHAEEARTLNPNSPLYVGYMQHHVASLRTGNLLALPSDIWVEKWTAYQNILAMGTTDGRVIILRLPKESI